MSNSLVSDAHVQAALEYLADDPHPVAVTKTMLLKAENVRKRTYAELFGRALGKSNPEKDAWVLTHADYVAAQEAEAEAMLEHERHRARVKSADTITELWRSVQANQRASERVR